MRRSRPNARGVIFTPGGAWRRLYSLRSTSWITRATVSGGDELLRREVLLHITAQDRVELFVRREAVGVLLAGLQLGRRRLGQDAFGDGGPQRVAIAAELVDGRLGDVFQHRIAAGDVAVQRAVPGRELGLVAGAQNDVAELVGQRMQDGRADARLEVFLRDTRIRALKNGCEDLFETAVRRLDREVH